MKSSAVLLVAVMVLLAGRAQGATFLQGLAGPTGLANEGDQGSSLRNDRFLSGGSSFIGASYDWSGVGFSNGGSWATMISPTYFVSAWHDHPTPGQTVTFDVGNGPTATAYTYTVGSFGFQTSSSGIPGASYAGSDVWLGQLTSPVASNIAKYPVLTLPSLPDYDGLPIWTYGYGATGPGRVGKSNISSYSGSISSGINSYSGVTALNGVYTAETSMVMYFNYYANGGQQGPDECYLEGGDSGGPAFTVVNGSLAVLGTGFVNAVDLQLTTPPGEYNVGIYNGAPSGDAFVPFYVSQLDAQMTGGEQITTVVPEPSVLALLLAASCGLVGVVLRHRHGAKR